jgi:serine/threonine protein kinase
VTLFETLALVHPFPIPKNIPQSCLATYLTVNDPLRLRELQPGLPARLEAIVARAMDRDPNRRYRSISDLTDDLERFVAASAARPPASRIPRPKFTALGLWPPRPGVNG